MMTMTDNQRIAADRIHDAERHAKLHPRQRRDHRRHRPAAGRRRIAAALHRLADRVEPAHRPALTVR